MAAPNKFGSNKAKSLLVEAAPPDSFDYVNDTAVHVGRWAKIRALNAVVIASITAANGNGSGTYTAVPLAAGAVFEGDITSFTLTSGAVQALSN